MGVWNLSCPSSILREPLVRTGRALSQFPFIAEQVLQVIVAPFRGSSGPRHLDPAGDGIVTVAGVLPVRPTQALRLDGCTFRFGTDILFRIGSAVRLAEAVAPSN